MKKDKRNRNVAATGSNSDTACNTATTTYEKAFLHMNEMQERGNKSIYLSDEYHKRLSRIVQVIGDDKIALFAYLNNILEHHFKAFEDMITKEFDEKHKNLF
jgi:predicted DNA-binding protein